MSTAFFGLQLALDLPCGHALRRSLGEAVAATRSATVPAQARQAWTRTAGTLLATLDRARLGTWDLVRTRATAEYEDWTGGIEAMAQWPESDFGSGGGLLLTSAVFLVPSGSNADRSLGDWCDIPEEAWQRRRTFERLIGALPGLNFSNVLACGLYLAPHPDRPGFADTVLRAEGFEYLAELS